MRDFIKRHMPPSTYHSLRLCWWQIHFYWPHRATSVLVQRRPKVECFPSHVPSQLGQNLRNVNVLAPTEMCRVMTKYGSDKGQGWHNYTTIYSEIFKASRNKPLRIFELGLGTTNPHFAFNMGSNGRPGASLRGWRELFPRALVYGADIDRAVLFKEDRIDTFYCNQINRSAVEELWMQPELRGGVDVIIDDGLHTFEANTFFLDESLRYLKPGGTYIIEDIFGDTITKWHHALNTKYATRWSDCQFALAEIPNPINRKDNNNLLVIRKQN